MDKQDKDKQHQEDTKKVDKVNEKNQDKNEGDGNMENVIDLKKYSDEDKVKDYSIFDMILNPVKRKEARKYFDDNYEETEEEKQIFEAWKKRRTRRDD